MLVNDKIILENWFVDDEFDISNVKISDDSKAYIDDLIKRTIEDKKRIIQKDGNDDDDNNEIIVE